MNSHAVTPVDPHTQNRNAPAEVRFAGDTSILLAEDNPVNQLVAGGMLDEMGCTVTMVDNGKEALEILPSVPFDMVLMDCQMPEMDGFEATKAIRQHECEQGLARIPIIALTANAMEGDRDRCLQAGMDDHLSKPFTRALLRDIVERWRSQLAALEPATEKSA